MVDVDLAVEARPGQDLRRTSSARRTATTTSAIVPLPLDDLSRRPESDLPPRRTEVLMTWFGAPEAGFGGMGGSGRIGLRGRGLHATRRTAAPSGSRGSASRSGAPRRSTARWFGPAAPRAVIESDLSPVGTDRLSGTVTNRLGVPLRARCSPSASRSTTSARSAPGESKQVELTQDRNLSGHLNALRRGRSLDPSNPGSATDRPRRA